MNPEQRNKAYSIVYIATRNGTLVKQPCEHCLEVNWKSEAHHEDYSKPLEVIWLCKLHHRLKHKQIKFHSTELITSLYTPKLSTI